MACVDETRLIDPRSVQTGWIWIVDLLLSFFARNETIGLICMILYYPAVLLEIY